MDHTFLVALLRKTLIHWGKKYRDFQLNYKDLRVHQKDSIINFIISLIIEFMIINDTE